MSANALAPIIAALRDPFFELDTGEAAAVFSAFDAARAAGQWFDDFTTALVGALKRQLLVTDDAGEDREQCVTDDEDDLEQADVNDIDEDTPFTWGYSNGDLVATRAMERHGVRGRAVRRNAVGANLCGGRREARHGR